MTILLNIIVFIIILTIIVSFHEFGHFLLAKLNGVYVYEFSIGMGPKLFGKTIGETEYSIRAIPIGGFCQLAGEDLDEDDSKKVPKNRRLQNKSPLQRFLIMAFGPINNFILAVFILLLIALIWGGSTMNPVISSVMKDSAAEGAGIRNGDTVLEVNGHKIKTSDDLSLYLAVADPKKESEFKVERDDGTYKTIKVKPKKVGEGKKASYVYGIEMKQKKTNGIGQAFVYTFNKTISIFKQMFVTVSYLFTGKISLNQLSGPVGIYSVVGESRAMGIVNLIYLMAFLSINVGFINLLPIPAFDGGHILFIIIELIKGSPVEPELENKIHAVFLTLLFILMIFITFNDILRLFNWHFLVSFFSNKKMKKTSFEEDEGMFLVLIIIYINNVYKYVYFLFISLLVKFSSANTIHSLINLFTDILDFFDSSSIFCSVEYFNLIVFKTDFSSSKLGSSNSFIVSLFL